MTPARLLTSRRRAPGRSPTYPPRHETQRSPPPTLPRLLPGKLDVDETAMLPLPTRNGPADVREIHPQYKVS